MRSRMPCTHRGRAVSLTVTSEASRHARDQGGTRSRWQRRRGSTCQHRLRRQGMAGRADRAEPGWPARRAVRLGPLAEMPRGMQMQVKAISSEWVEDKGLPEMGFTLGGVDEALDPSVRVGLAIDDDATVHGVTSWMPFHASGGGAPAGRTLDVMRRLPGGFRYSMGSSSPRPALPSKRKGVGSLRCPARHWPGPDRRLGTRHSTGARSIRSSTGSVRRWSPTTVSAPCTPSSRSSSAARAALSRVSRRGGATSHRAGAQPRLPSRCRRARARGAGAFRADLSEV